MYEMSQRHPVWVAENHVKPCNSAAGMSLTKLSRAGNTVIKSCFLQCGAYVHYRSRTLAIKVCLSFNFAVVFNFIEFPCLPSKSKVTGDVLMVRQNVATMYLFFKSFITHIDQKKTAKKKFGNYKYKPRKFVTKHQSVTQKTKLIQKGDEKFAAFCLCMGTPLKICALHGVNGDLWILKSIAKLKDIRTSIATFRASVRYLLPVHRMYTNFSTILDSHCRLSLFFN